MLDSKRNREREGWSNKEETAPWQCGFVARRLTIESLSLCAPIFIDRCPFVVQHFFQYRRDKRDSFEKHRLWSLLLWTEERQISFFFLSFFPFSRPILIPTKKLFSVIRSNDRTFSFVTSKEFFHSVPTGSKEKLVSFFDSLESLEIGYRRGSHYSYEWNAFRKMLEVVRDIKGRNGIRCTIVCMYILEGITLQRIMSAAGFAEKFMIPRAQQWI